MVMNVVSFLSCVRKELTFKNENMCDVCIGFLNISRKIS